MPSPDVVFCAGWAAGGLLFVVWGGGVSTTTVVAPVDAVAMSHGRSRVVALYTPVAVANWCSSSAERPMQQRPSMTGSHSDPHLF